MNIVFTLLVLGSVVVAAITGSPAHDAVLSGWETRVELAAGSAVAVGAPARVEAGGVEYPGLVMEVDAPVTPGAPSMATVRTIAPDGPICVRLDDEHAMKLVSSAALDSASKAVEIAIGLVGVMTLFLGLMKVVEAGGGLDLIASALRPLMVWLFPDVPAKHPAMSAMVMNLAANMLGLGNAATPFGIKAMQQLDTLNRQKGTATNAMVMFLAINTTGLAVLPTTMMAMRAALGSKNPAAILPTTLAASHVTTVAAVLLAKGLSRFFPGAAADPVKSEPLRLVDFVPFLGATSVLLALCLWVGLDDHATYFVVPVVIGGMVLFGQLRGVKVYETLIEGAREGFDSSVRIIPYVVAILVAAGMFRASGALGLVVAALSGPAKLVGLPPEVIPVAILRPLSGSGAQALAIDLSRVHGPDSFIGNLVGTMQGTTETTFYVLAVYFGAVGVKKVRHAVAVGLLSEFVGVLAAVFFVRMFLGGG